MTHLGDFVRWFSGGRDGYMSLDHCMRGDTFWITLTILLDIAVALGYILIARHWWINEKLLPASPAKTALGNMKRIFIFCGMCGYLFIPIKMFWPAWRLYDGFMVALVFFTWRYALNSRQLRVVYHNLIRTEQLAAELEESRAAARRKTFFLNAISHDLRTPLNGLMLQADLAEMSASAEDFEGLLESIREVKSCARTAADLLGCFLELGRLDWTEDQGLVARFPVDELLAQVIGSARPLAEGKGLRLDCQAPAGLHFRTDRVKLERILQNLVGNAVKFTDRGTVEVSVQVAGTGATIVVADTGPGIPAELLDSIFEEFFQVGNLERHSSKGFGLGLTISRRLVGQIGGVIAVESEVGRGSRFLLTLPGVVDGVGPRAPTVGVLGNRPPAPIA